MGGLVVFIAIAGAMLGGFFVQARLGDRRSAGAIILAGMVGAYCLVLGAGLVGILRWHIVDEHSLAVAIFFGPVAALVAARGRRAYLAPVAVPTNVNPATRALYGLFDGIVFFGIWVAVQSVTGATVPIGFMQSYTRQQYDNYVYVMSWMTLGLFISSILMHRLLGGSAGKIVAGSRTIMADGSALTWRAATMRATILFLIGLLITAPGPLIAFIFGPGSEISSLVALSLGLILWVWIVLMPQWFTDQDIHPSPLERWSGMKTVDYLQTNKTQ